MHNTKPRTLGPTAFLEGVDWELMWFLFLFSLFFLSFFSLFFLSFSSSALLCSVRWFYALEYVLFFVMRV
jgi:hypothetical protein